LPLEHLHLLSYLLLLPLELPHIPQGAYTIGPHYFDPLEIRHAITGQASTSSFPVFLPNSNHAILVPVKFFNNLFPPSSVSIYEID
ncbi:hypothetical protein ALC56_12795, partial [Trachymyrmex septentrionalis]